MKIVVAISLTCCLAVCAVLAEHQHQGSNLEEASSIASDSNGHVPDIVELDGDGALTELELTSHRELAGLTPIGSCNGALNLYFIAALVLVKLNSIALNAGQGSVVTQVDNQRMRIDIQGNGAVIPSGLGNTPLPAGQYYRQLAAQYGSDSYAGVWVPVDTTIPTYVINRAMLYSAQNNRVVAFVPNPGTTGLSTWRLWDTALNNGNGDFVDLNNYRYRRRRLQACPVPTWSPCYSDQDAADMGFANRDAAGAAYCRLVGYGGVNPASDGYASCSVFTSQYMFQCADTNSGDKTRSPCYRNEDAAAMSLASRDDAGTLWCQNNGYQTQNGYYDCGNWYFSFQCDTSSSSCFSEYDTVEVMGKGAISMNDIKIGDMAMNAVGKFDQVYSFGHYAPNKTSEFLQIYSSGDMVKPLEVTADHLLSVGGAFIPASAVTVGDKLNLGKNSGLAEVEKIQTVVRSGLYAPFTTSGNVIVNGIVASCYIGLQNDSNVLIGGYKTPFTAHFVSHVFQAPHRLLCKFNWNSCAAETFNDNGISVLVAENLALGKWILKQNAIVMTLTLIPAFLALLLFYTFELILANMVLLVVAVVAVWFVVASVKKAKKKM